MKNIGLSKNMDFSFSYHSLSTEQFSFVYSLYTRYGLSSESFVIKRQWFKDKWAIISKSRYIHDK